MSSRVDRETALMLLASPVVTLSEPEPVEDVDGLPLGVELVARGTGVLHVTPEQLGWTWAELRLDDPEVDQ